jgi:hypothetical protein
MSDVSANSPLRRHRLDGPPEVTLLRRQPADHSGNATPDTDTRIEVLSFGLLACTCGDENPSVIPGSEDTRVCVRPRHDLAELHEALDGTTW